MLVELIFDVLWIGLLYFQFLDFVELNIWLIIVMFLLVVLVLIVENVGYVCGVVIMIEDFLINKYIGWVLIVDGVVMIVVGGFGGFGIMIYGENIGVMVVICVYLIVVYWVVGLFVILLVFFFKVGEVFNLILVGVFGGVIMVLYGFIGIIGIKIWVDSCVDFFCLVNQYIVVVLFVIGIVGFLMQLGDFVFGGIVFGMVVVFFIYYLGNLIVCVCKIGVDDLCFFEFVGFFGGDFE